MIAATPNGTMPKPGTDAEYQPPRRELPGGKGFVNIASTDDRLFNHATMAQAQREAERLALEKGLTVIVSQPLLIVSPPTPRPAVVKFIEERTYAADNSGGIIF